MGNDGSTPAVRAMLVGWTIVLGASVCGAAHAGGTGEISIGRTADNNLVADFGFVAPLTVPRSVFPGFSGYATGSIGWENVPIDDPVAGIYVLSPGSDVSARLVAIDSGVALYAGLAALAVGGTLEFGQPFFDFHPICTIPDPLAAHGETFSLRFVLHDASGTHLDSDPFDLILTPACHADIDNGSGTGTRDDGVDVNDLLYFLAGFEAGSVGVDLDDGSGWGVSDGGVDVNDLLFFLGHFEGGC